MTRERERMKAAAEKATPGPWEVKPSSGPNDWPRLQRPLHSVDPEMDDDWQHVTDLDTNIDPDDAAYLAACNPAAILRLLARVERLEADRETIRAAVIACAYCNGVGSLLCLPGDVIEPCPACGGLRAALAATQEPDRG